MSLAITQFHMKSSYNTLTELENIQFLASKFLESYMNLETCFVDSSNIEKSIKVKSKRTLTMQLEIIPQSHEEIDIDNHSKEIVKGTTMHAAIPDECNCTPSTTSNWLPPSLLHL